MKYKNDIWETWFQNSSMKANVDKFHLWHCDTGFQKMDVCN